MKLVVGLGNPGRKYDGTRHNVGYQVLAELARRGGSPKLRRSFQGESGEVTIDGQRTLLLWPHTFMNCSGSSVLEARDFYKLQNDELLIVCDDFHLPLAKLRFRSKGSSGGQKGVADCIRVLGTEELPRLRVGIGEVPPDWDPADFVLSRFTAQEQSVVTEITRDAAEAVEAWVRHGIEHCMNQYN